MTACGVRVVAVFVEHLENLGVDESFPSETSTIWRTFLIQQRYTRASHAKHNMKSSMETLVMEQITEFGGNHSRYSERPYDAITINPELLHSRVVADWQNE